MITDKYDPYIIYNLSGEEIGRIELRAFPDESVHQFIPRTGLTPQQALQQFDSLINTLKSERRCHFCRQSPTYCQC